MLTCFTEEAGFEYCWYTGCLDGFCGFRQPLQLHFRRYLEIRHNYGYSLMIMLLSREVLQLELS
jgi:hypothetical protein